jgi:hypothetical protein
MGKTWRFIVSCRYLLLACLVLAATWGYLFVPRLSLWGRYEKLNDLCAKRAREHPNVTGPQVEETLGRPQRTEEVFDFRVWTWREGQETVTILLSGGDPPIVFSRHFRGPQGTAVQGSP